MTLVFDSIPIDSHFNCMPYLPEYKTIIFSLSSEKWGDPYNHIKVKHILYRYCPEYWKLYRGVI